MRNAGINIETAVEVVRDPLPGFRRRDRRGSFHWVQRQVGEGETEDPCKDTAFQRFFSFQSVKLSIERRI